MRCLRCAIDYGPDERYCQRCGRTLSKPIGSQSEPASARPGNADTAYLYSTFSPPAVGDIHGTGADPLDDEASIRYGAHDPSPHEAWQEDVPLEEDDDPWSGESVASAADELDDSFEGMTHKVLVPVHDDDSTEGDDDEPPAVVDVLYTSPRQARNGISAGTGGRRTQPSRALLMLIALLVILLAAGGFALSRHASYADKLNTARTLRSRAQYQSAIDTYQQAINVWPLNDDAKKGQAAAVAALAAQRAAAAAAAAAQQAQAQATRTRGEMYQAKQLERRTAAQQFDASAAVAVAPPVSSAHTQAPAAVHATTATHSVRATGRAGHLRAMLLAGKPVIYAAIGASETVGVGADDPATQSWVADLARRLPPGSRLLNLGKSGALLSYGVQSELPQAIAGNPDVVTIWMAVNDLNALLKARPTSAAFEQQLSAAYGPHLATLLATLHSRTHAALFVGNIPDVALEPAYRSQGLTEQQLAPYVTAFNQTIASVARAHGATVVDLYAPTKATLPAHPEYLSGDGFHPSTLGYANIAAVWWRIIRGTAHAS